jgi:hypothetical protein
MNEGREERMVETHSARPTDLVALVTFDDEVYVNQAVVRERIAHPSDAPKPIGAAIEQWLGLGRQTWIDMRGRQIEGIATARELSDGVWLIDTLIDASLPRGEGPEGTAVVEALLRKATNAAPEHQVTHVLLRTALDAPAHGAALRAGFKRVVVEEVWRGALGRSSSLGAAPGVEVREARDSDEFGRFQLFNRALPIDARQAIAMTVEEWRATRERRWLGRGSSEWVALAEDRVVGVLRLNPSGEVAQLDLMFDPNADGARGALLEAAARVLAGANGASEAREVLAVVPASTPAMGAALGERGFRREAEYALLCYRTQRVATERRAVPAGMAVPTGG